MCRIGGGVDLELEATQNIAAHARDADLTRWEILGLRGDPVFLAGVIKRVVYQHCKREPIWKAGLRTRW